MLRDLQGKYFAFLYQLERVQNLILCVVLLQQVSHVDIEIAQLPIRGIKIDTLMLVLAHDLAEDYTIFLQLSLLICNELLGKYASWSTA